MVSERSTALSRYKSAELHTKHNWYFDDADNFRDPAGNAYRPCDLEATWWGRQLYRDLVGTSANVRVLKCELQWKSGIGDLPAHHQPNAPHRVYIEPFLGSGAVLKHKRPAQENIGIELDQTVIEHYHRHPAPGCTLIHGDGIQYLRQREWQGDELVYCDPPYVEASRTGGRLYNHEMTQAQHQALLETLIDLKAAGVLVMLSGYHSKLYAKVLKGWTLITFGSMTRRGMALEHLWMSFPEPLELHDYRYLGEDYRERERIKRKIARWTTKLQDMPTLESRALLAALQNLKGPLSSETTMRS